MLLLKFHGVSPSTTIGTVFITIGLSFVPVGTQKGLFQLTPRNSYEGFHRSIAHIRSQG